MSNLIEMPMKNFRAAEPGQAEKLKKAMLAVVESFRKRLEG